MKLKCRNLKRLIIKKDPNVMLVKMPGLEEISINLHDYIARPKKKSSEKKSKSNKEIKK